MFTAHKFGQWCCGPSAGICRCTRRRPSSSKYAGFVIISVTRCRMPCAFFMDQHFKFTQNSFKIQISSTFRITSMKYVLASERMRICALLARRSFNTSKADGTFPTITSIEWLLCDDMTLTKGMLWSTWLICSRVTPWSCSSQRLWSLIYFRPLFVCKTKHESNKAVCCSYIKSVHCMFPKAATFVHCSSDNPLTTDWSLSASIRDLFAGAKYAIKHFFFSFHFLFSQVYQSKSKTARSCTVMRFRLWGKKGGFNGDDWKPERQRRAWKQRTLTFYWVFFSQQQCLYAGAADWPALL